MLLRTPRWLRRQVGAKLLLSISSASFVKQISVLLARSVLYYGERVCIARICPSGGSRGHGPRRTRWHRNSVVVRPSRGTRWLHGWLKLERENERLKRRLQQAETVIEVQEKISELLQIPLTRLDRDENN